MPMNYTISNTTTEKVFVDQLEQWYINNGFLTKREVNAGHGIADLVVTKLDKNQCNKRLKHGQITPLLKDKYFQALKYIPDVETQKKPVDIEYLVHKTKLSKNFLKYDALRTLEEHKYIITINKTTYMKVNGWAPLAREVIAIEAKLKDWNQGVLQAIRYNSFADYIYLAIPNGDNVDRERLKKFGVGLLVINPDNQEPTVVLKAKKQNVISNSKRNYVLEHFWEHEFQEANCFESASV